MNSNQLNYSYAFAKKFLVRNPKIGAGRARIVAVLWDRSNTILSHGWNQYKSHPLQAKFANHPDKIYLHAEIDCIANALRNYRGINIGKTLTDSTMYVFRFDSKFTLMLAKPCTGCQRALASFNIKEVYWGGE